MLRLKRAYEPPNPSDGRRILVDRLWPRGLSKEKAASDELDLLFDVLVVPFDGDGYIGENAH